MKESVRILFLSANPWTTSRILVDEEAREVFEKLQEGSHRGRFELHKHAAIRPADLQRLLLMYKPHIVHFSGHGHKKQRIILGSSPGRGKLVDRQGLAKVFALYRSHLRLVFLNACFTRLQACSLTEVIDFAIGTSRGVGDKGSVIFAGAFYRALAFGLSITEAFASAKAELGLRKVPRTHGLELFVRDAAVREHFIPPRDSSSSLSNAKPVARATDGYAIRSEIDPLIDWENAFGEPAFLLSTDQITRVFGSGFAAIKAGTGSQHGRGRQLHQRTSVACSKVWASTCGDGPLTVARRLVLMKYEQIESGIRRSLDEQPAVKPRAVRRASGHKQTPMASLGARSKNYPRRHRRKGKKSVRK